MRRFIFCVLFGAMSFAPCSTHALPCGQECTFAYQFQFSDGTVTANLSGQLKTSNTLDSSGGYDVLSMNGTSTITGLGSSYGPLSIGLTPLPGYTYDNILYFPKASFAGGGSGYFDFGGIVFQDAAGTFYNIFTEGDQFIFIVSNDPSLGNTTLDWVSGNVSPVPEPSTWAMLLIGFVGLGLVACRRGYGPAYSLI
jgi:hypothetical protein